jgi:hypothetical protein
MVLYVQLMLFFICLNFGLGIAHIPDTPLTIPDSQKAQTGECLNDFYTQGLLVRVPATGFDANGNVAYIMATDGQGNSVLPNFNQTATEIAAGESTVGGIFTVYDTIMDPIDAMNAGINTFTDIMFGGYITNVLDSLTFECDTVQFNDPPVNSDPNSNYGQSKDSEVMVYFKAGVQIIYGLMFLLLIFYLITGRDFGL